MLAWRWWRNRQGSTTYPGSQQRFSDQPRTPSAGAL